VHERKRRLAPEKVLGGKVKGKRQRKGNLIKERGRQTQRQARRQTVRARKGHFPRSYTRGKTSLRVSAMRGKRKRGVGERRGPRRKKIIQLFVKLYPIKGTDTPQRV